jgi:hypothetical protein
MARSGKNPDAEWQKHKATIHRIYITENQHLTDLMSEMASLHGFSAR